MKHKDKRPKKFSTFAYFLLTSFLLSFINGCITRPIILKHGDTTVGYVTSTSRKIRGFTYSIHYSYIVSGKEYRAKCGEPTAPDSNLEIIYLKSCPRIHTYKFPDDEQEKGE